ncbi:hypothetical protein HZH68_016896 [Vespula germanica]|uniref:Uncharacterized protein n=1 Tax=Vespula germanica TaxID=30212 RepID=A0A834J0D8_VESGE|nr:hypothetical protein HZH68_016896 [Vespula germanica]
MYHENDAAVLLLFDEVIHGNANNTNRMGTAERVFFLWEENPRLEIFLALCNSGGLISSFLAEFTTDVDNVRSHGESAFLLLTVSRYAVRIHDDQLESILRRDRRKQAQGENYGKACSSSNGSGGGATPAPPPPLAAVAYRSGLAIIKFVLNKRNNEFNG